MRVYTALSYQGTRNHYCQSVIFTKLVFYFMCDLYQLYLFNMATCQELPASDEGESSSEYESDEAEETLKSRRLTLIRPLTSFALCTGLYLTELADIPLGELQDMRKKLGIKKFDTMMKKSLQERETRSFKRSNKNRYRIMHKNTKALRLLCRRPFPKRLTPCP